MTYATLAQLTARYGLRMIVLLTDRAEEAAGEIDQAVVNRALADADAIIDGYLGRYKLASVKEAKPPLLADLAQAIAIWKLHIAAPDPKIEADYKDALRLLRDVADGRIRLQVEGGEPEGSGGSGARMTDRERPLTEATLKGWI